MAHCSRAANEGGCALILALSALGVLGALGVFGFFADDAVAGVVSGAIVVGGGAIVVGVAAASPSGAVANGAPLCCISLGGGVYGPGCAHTEQQRSAGLPLARDSVVLRARSNSTSCSNASVIFVTSYHNNHEINKFHNHSQECHAHHSPIAVKLQSLPLPVVAGAIPFVGGE